ncbi:MULTISPECIES: efflux RND transporter periplasmic adaptor subunit [unclassified Bradyrhizobium]|nr:MULTISPECIES: efflux RND transporter periplasmic adaptor subunit [unclassified Bradyrhizobium]
MVAVYRHQHREPATVGMAAAPQVNPDEQVISKETVPPSGPPVPVTAAKVQQHDVPIVLEGLGTVQALNNATLHTQVQGTLDTVDFVEGQPVKRGQLLAQIDPRVYQAQVDQAKAALGRDKALLANAQADLGRVEPLLARGFATPQQVDTQKAQVGQLENTVKLDEAALEGAHVQLGFTSITAPFDGVTGIRKIDPGNIVHPTDAEGLVVLTQMQPISVIFTLPSADIPRVQQGLAKGEANVEAYDAANKVKLDQGRLMLVDNQVDPSTGTVKLKATFPNAQNTLWPGAFVNIHLVIAVRHNALTVPLQAVQQGPNGPYVYVIKFSNTGETVTAKPVTIGQSRDGQAMIESGIAATDTVVLAGQYRLFEGARVEIARGAAASQVQNASTASSGMLP